MKKITSVSILAMAITLSAAFATETPKTYINGLVSCDGQVVTPPNIGYCRSISGGNPGGLLYAIDVTKKDRPVIQQEGMWKVDPIAHMKILEVSDLAERRMLQCSSLLVEHETITWIFTYAFVDCLKKDGPDFFKK